MIRKQTRLAFISTMNYIIKIQNQLESYPKYRLIYHLSFWVIYTVFLAFTFKSFYPGKQIFEIILYFIITTPLDALATYFTVYILVSIFLLNKRYWEFILLLIISSLLFVLLQKMQLYFILYPYFFLDFTPTGQWYNLDYFYTITNIYPIVGIFAGIKFVKEAFIIQKINEDLEKKKLEAELKFLKSQIHPHFLFNTLNNLYALTLDKSDQAPEVVIKLSGLLDYMLYEANVSRVPLLKEVHMLQNYIKLENIRYGKDAHIDFTVTGDTAGKSIAPLILLPFVENSFKHGLSQKTSAHRVEINLSCKNEILNFKVKNGKSNEKFPIQKEYTEGIGLKNVKRRLDILYPNKHRLHIEKKTTSFNVELEIRID